MKHRILSLILISLMITGCTQGVKSTSKSSIPLDAQLEASAAPYDDLRIVRSNTTLRHGDQGSITIKGKPGEKYVIKTYFNMNGQRIGVTQLRIADNNGEAIFNWVVSEQTDGGTYTGTISGGGRSIEISHTVVP